MSPLLVVEDEQALARLVRDYLERVGFQVRLAGDAASALQHFAIDKPALIVLDLGLPDRDGLDVIRAIRKTSDTPIIVLTARGDEWIIVGSNLARRKGYGKFNRAPLVDRYQNIVR